MSGRDCRISQVGNYRSYMLTRYQDGLHDLTGSVHQIQHAYKLSGRAAGSHGFGTTDRICLRGIRTGLQDLTDSEHQMVHAYKVSGRGSHGFGNPDRTCPRSIRMGMQELTGWEHQIGHDYSVSGRCFRISRVRNIRSYMPTRYQDAAALSHG